ncbi:MAG: hypothetical protein ABUT11_01690, partial [Leifsonia sp.]
MTGEQTTSPATAADTPAAAAAATPAAARVDRPLYLRLWAGVPRELGYLFIAFPIATVGFAIAVTLFSSGVGTIVTFFIG